MQPAPTRPMSRPACRDRRASDRRHAKQVCVVDHDDAGASGHRREASPVETAGVRGRTRGIEHAGERDPVTRSHAARVVVAPVQLQVLALGRTAAHEHGVVALLQKRLHAVHGRVGADLHAHVADVIVGHIQVGQRAVVYDRLGKRHGPRVADVVVTVDETVVLLALVLVLVLVFVIIFVLSLLNVPLCLSFLFAFVVACAPLFVIFLLSLSNKSNRYDHHAPSDDSLE